MKKDAFFGKMKNLGLALSYGDVRLKTGYSEVSPADADISGRFSRGISLKCPIVSSPMDTVTEHDMAIALAKAGGLGIIHRMLSPEEQAKEVAKVKFHLNCLIRKPVCVGIDDRIEDILTMIERRSLSFRSFPVVGKDGKMVGIITGSDFELCSDVRKTAGEVTSNGLVTIDEPLPLERILAIMQENKKKVLPVINKDGSVAGMYIFSDVKRIITGSSSVYSVDLNGNLRVGAAVGTGEKELERVDSCVAKGVDVIVIDTAHGDSKGVYETLKLIKDRYSGIEVVVGNVSEGESAKRLAEAGADGIKVGQGPGSICTTRIVAGIGCPQVTAVYSCAKAVRGMDIPICADGGVKYSGDVTIAIAAGADTVMLGNMLAGTTQSPGEVIMHQGFPVKGYRGMGSLGAMKSSASSRERYRQSGESGDKLVPEGVEGIVPFKGDVFEVLFQIIGGLRAGMGYAGVKNIAELHQKADFYRISSVGLGESHPHGVKITEKVPNYSGF